MLTLLKRPSALLVLLALIVPILAACGSGGTTSAPTAAPASSGAATSAPAAATTAPADKPTEAAMTDKPTVATAPTTMADTPTDAAASGNVQVQEPANKDDLAKLSGDIVIDGSSTVFPITQAAAEEFRKYAKGVRVSVGISGTGGGFKKFCNGETDISDASRPIQPAEVDACKAKNIEYIELPVAYDGLVVVVNPANDWAKCLTVPELKKMWEPDAQGKITNWKQIRDSFPDQALTLYGAGTDSGTFDYFTEAIIGKSKASRGDYQATEDDNVTVQGVSGDKGALGYFGLAYLEENQGKIKAVAIDAKGDGKCVYPSFATVKDGSYQPLSRPLFIYVKKEAAARPEVQAFVNFYLSKSFTPLIQTPQVGYVLLDDKLYDAAAKRFKDGTLGTLWPKGAEVGATLDRYLK
jgi:phosphate transport system substrate-binding protein